MPVTLLKFQEVTQRYRLLPSVLQSLIRDGTIRTVRLDGEELIPAEDVAMAVGQPHVEENNDRWIPLAEAIRLHPEVDEAILRKLVKDGVIASKTPPDSDEELVDGRELIEVARKLDRRQWRALEGVGISINAAAKKYGFYSKTLWKWAQDGHIRILRRDTYRVYLDESDVRFAHVLAELAGRQGRALFPKCS